MIEKVEGEENGVDDVVYGSVAAAIVLLSLTVVIIFVYICNRLMLLTKGIDEGREVSLGTVLTEFSAVQPTYEDITENDVEDSSDLPKFKSTEKLVDETPTELQQGRGQPSSQSVNHTASQHGKQSDEQSIETIEYIPPDKPNSKSTAIIVEKKQEEETAESNKYIPPDMPNEKSEENNDENLSFEHNTESIEYISSVIQTERKKEQNARNQEKQGAPHDPKFPGSTSIISLDKL